MGVELRAVLSAALSGVSSFDLDELRHPEVRERVRQADVIFGHDVGRGEDILFYGRAALKGGRGTPAGAALRTVRIRHDQRTDSPEALFASVEALKGYREYEYGPTLA